MESQNEGTVAALQTERRRLAFLLSATSAVTYSCEVRPPFGATFVSDNLEALLGYSPLEFVKEPGFWATHIHPEDRDRILAGVGKVFDEGRLTHEYRFLGADGRYRWLHDDLVLVKDDAGEAIEMVGVFYDVSSRKETEEARERFERNFRALIEVLPVGVMVHRERRIAYTNRAMLTLLGYDSSEQLVGLSPFVLVPESAHAAVEERLRFLEASPDFRLKRPLELEMMRLDETRVPAEIEAIKIDFDGAPGVLVIVRDMTERRTMLARLAVADRLASMGRLAAGVAHEINNPLSYVLANLALVAQRLPLLVWGEGTSLQRAEVEELLHDAYDGAVRVKAVVRDLRSLSRQDDEAVAPVEIHAVIESCLRIAANEIRHSAKLMVDLQRVPIIHANASRLGQVFLNLIINATQALADRDADTNELRVITGTTPDGDALIEVSDTGPGIAPEIIAHVFDPFFTTKPIGAGTGLGLSICHGIVTSMNGTITVESELGVGATFRVVLPPGLPMGANAAVPRERAVPSVRRGRVLLIDDERALGTTLRFLLKPHHDVTAVLRANEALDLIERGEPFDVILCDLMMPEVSGMQFFDRLCELAPSLCGRVVFITGGAFSQAAREFLQRVPNPRLEKPFDVTELQSLIAGIVRR